MARAVPSLVGALALAALAAASPAVAGGWWDDLDKGDSVRLSDLIADPHAKREGAVTFPCVFRALDRVFFPYFTSFTPEKHINVSAWLDGAPIWERESYTRDEFPFLYLRRDHPQRDEILRLQPFTRIEITGRIRDVYRDRPWIEILAFRPTAATLGKDVVEYVKTGDGFASRGDATHADAYYSRALFEVSLEETYALRIRKRRGDVLRSAGHDADAALAQGGTILGGTPIPAADPASPPPAFPAAPAPGPGGDTFPDAPIPSVRTPPAAPCPPTEARPAELTTTDLPGIPYGAPNPPPPAPRDVRVPKPEASKPAAPAPAKAAAPGPGALPPPPPPATRDAPEPVKTKVPGDVPAAPAKTVVPAPPPPPPPRVPRLSGVR